MTTRRSVIWATLAFACSGAFGQEYEIRLDRPSKVGERYELTASGSTSQHMKVSSEGKVTIDEKSSLTAKLEGTITVLEINERKQANKIRLTVSKCLMSTGEDPKEKEALAKGTQVVAQLQDGEQVFLIDGKPVSPRIKEMLGLFITLPMGEATDDDIFGTKDRKKVGDSWPVNSALAAKDLLAEGVQVKAESIKGRTKLDKVVVIDGTKCLQLSAKLEASYGIPPELKGVAVDKSRFSAVFSGAFPIDLSMGPLSEKVTMTIVFAGKGKPDPDGPQLTMSMKMSASTQKTRKFLK